MKNLSFFNRIIFAINLVFSILLLLSFLLPFIPPKSFHILSVLNLGVSTLILINVLFVLYWLIKLKTQINLSLVVLVCSVFVFDFPYQFSTKKETKRTSSIKVMTYNVRLFNLYDWIPEDHLETKIVDLIRTQNPDIISFQEYYNHKGVDLSAYPYKYDKYRGNSQFGLALFSKYPIINSGSLDFPYTGNNAIFIDVVKEKRDTLRVYSIHLESLRIGDDITKLKDEDSERLFEHFGTTFKKQQEQAELFLKHKSQCKYKTVICGDFNNTEYSYVYRKIKGSMNDAFKEAGHGFGRTYNFKYFPLRIDFIFADDDFIVNDFQTIDKKYSDHFPISTTLSLK